MHVLLCNLQSHCHFLNGVVLANGIWGLCDINNRKEVSVLGLLDVSSADNHSVVLQCYDILYSVIRTIDPQVRGLSIIY